MNYAVVEKNSNKAVAIINSDFKAYFEVYFSIFDIVEIASVGEINILTEKGTVSTIAILPVGKDSSKDTYHMIDKYPEGISLTEAYSLIKK